MSKTFYDNLGSAATSATITLASLATSATAGRQSDAITFLDGSNNVPRAIDVVLTAKVTSGTIANDKTVYLFLAQSVDGTNYDQGPPAVGASDAAFTFTNSPIGTSPLPTGLRFIGAITFNAQNESQTKTFAVRNVPPKGVFVVMNYTGIALTSTAGDHSLKYRVRNPQAV